MCNNQDASIFLIVQEFMIITSVTYPSLMYHQLQAEAHLAARRKARYEARNIRLREMEKKQKAEMETDSLNNSKQNPITASNSNTSITNNHTGKFLHVTSFEQSGFV